MTTLDESILECRRITRASRSSFRFAFGVLPRKQRQAMDALYAFFRLTDDLGDDETLGDEETRREKLQDWRQGLQAALTGSFSHSIHPAVHWAVETFGIPPQYLFDVLDGCESDLQPRTFTTSEELLRYCYQVASAVGLACIRVWGLKPGHTWEQAEPLAIDAGYAFQLTNILRDLGSDAATRRVYLPTEELTRFSVDPAMWKEPSQRKAFESLLQFQVERAREYYRRSADLSDMLAPRGRAIHELMRRAYSGLLERVDQAGASVLTQRIRLSRWEKCKLLARVLKAKLCPV